MALFSHLCTRIWIAILEYTFNTDQTKILSITTSTTLAKWHYLERGKKKEKEKKEVIDKCKCDVYQMLSISLV